MKGLRCAGEDEGASGVLGKAVSNGPVNSAAHEPAAAERSQVSAEPAHPSGVFLDMVPHEYARRHLLLVLNDGTLLRATSTPPLVVFNITSRLRHAGLPIAEEQVALAENAMELVTNASYLPSSRRQNQQARLDAILEKIQVARRMINQDKALADAMTKLRLTSKKH